ncbi:MAG TPA: NAD(P)H-dependent oxidoreductase subunit E [Acidobacteriota bacterium]|nr:NAD(P)H-dependent oxidoreductase subunit E [Acidobacteriota bacterium]
MNIEKRKSVARWIGISSGIAVILCTGYLIGSYALARYQAAHEKSLVESMEEAVKLDAEVSVELTAERERQTAKSLKRRSWNDWAAVMLVIGAACFLTSMNWRKALEGDPALTLEKLERFRQVAGSSSRVLEAPLCTLETGDEPQIDLAIVQQLVDQEGRAPDAAIPILREIQLHYGYLPDEALKRVCELTDITPAQIAGTSTFYSQFRQSPIGEHLVKVCHGTACHVSGVVQITEELHRYLSIPPDGDTDPSRTFTLEKVACLGCCSLAPVIMIDDHTVGRLTPAEACHALQVVESEEGA